MQNFDCDPGQTSKPFEHRDHLRLLMASALLSSLIIIGTFLRIPFFLGIPITFQVPMIQVATFGLPKPYGIYSVAGYLLLGAAGFPVFTAGGGIGLFFEKTGGYLVGFLIATILFQVQPRWWKTNILTQFLALLLHTVVIFALGIGWHCYLEGIPVLKMVTTMTPFFGVAFIKLFISLFLLHQFEKILNR